MGNIFFFDWELRLIAAFQSVCSGFLTAAATFFSMLGEEYFMIIAVGFTYWCWNKELGRRVALALSGAMTTSSLIKNLALRRRPYMDNSEIQCIRAAYPKEDPMSPTAQGFSLPSLHSSMSASVYGTIAHETKKPPFVVLAIVLPLLIGLSRIYLGVHFPTDVLCGWLLGGVMMFALGAAADRFGYKACFAATLLIGAAGFFYCRDNEFYSIWGITLGLLLGFIYEEKNVGFETAKKWWSYILRPALGVAIFALVSAVLKLPAKAISAEWLTLAYRSLRYAIATFVIIGPYTGLFAKLGI